MSKRPKTQKPRLMKEGKAVETVDSRISKLSLEELQSKLADAERNAAVYREAIDARKQDEINKRLEELRSLGWSPSPASRNTLAKPKSQRIKKDEPCSVCQFKTEPLHDARKHRSQGDKKKPFTDEELAANNLRKVS